MKYNLQIQWALWFNFCEYFAFSVLPSQKQVVVLFIQFLTRKLTALSLVKNYVAGVRTLHKLLGLDTLAFKDVTVHLMWMGLERNWVNPVHISAPITPQVL